jgi:hypothetical protein
MKKIFTFLATASIFAACTSKSDLDTQKDVVVVDTTSMYKSNASTDISPAEIEKEEAPRVAQPRVINRTRTVYVDRTPRAPRQIIREADPVEPVVTNVPQTQPSAGTGTTQTPGVGTTSPDAGTANVPTAKEEDKGWKNSTKGAVIGGVGGAIAGAVLSKKKGKGAVIGGVIGAAGGYILGRKKDKAAEANETANYASY